jgi:DNA-binding protein YbaB
MFGQLKDLWKLKNQMAEIKKRLDNMVIKVESPRHWVELTMSGSMEVKEVHLHTPEKYDAADLEKELKESFNKAVRETQAMAAQAMGNFDLPQA